MVSQRLSQSLPPAGEPGLKRCETGLMFGEFGEIAGLGRVGLKVVEFAVAAFVHVELPAAGADGLDGVYPFLFGVVFQEHGVALDWLDEADAVDGAGPRYPSEGGDGGREIDLGDEVIAIAGFDAARGAAIRTGFGRDCTIWAAVRLGVRFRWERG